MKSLVGCCDEIFVLIFVKLLNVDTVTEWPYCLLSELVTEKMQALFLHFSKIEVEHVASCKNSFITTTLENPAFIIHLYL